MANSSFTPTVQQSPHVVVTNAVDGLMPASNASLSDATATRLGLKQYLHGTTYNGGNAPTVSGTVIRAVFSPYQTQGGSWRLKFNICTNLTITSSPSITVNGVVFRNTTNYFQAVSFSGANAAAGSIYVTPNSNIISGLTTADITSFSVSGDVELESKPSWCY